MKIREGKKQLLSEINLSPILDLSLMLVIFLAVTTEFISGGEVKVQVPKGGAKLQASGEVVKVIIDKWGKYYYKGKVYSDPAKLLPLLPKGERIFIKADKDVPYKYVFTFLDLLRKSGVRKVSLVGQNFE